MDLQAEKIDLAKRLLDTDDENVLLQIRAILDDNKVDFWKDLPLFVKEGIKRGQNQAAESKLTSNEEVMKKYARYL